LGNLKVQICSKSGRKCKQKMPHRLNQLFPQLSDKENHEQSLNLPSLLFCRLMKGVQLKSIKSDSTFAWHAMDHSVIDNATDEWR